MIHADTIRLLRECDAGVRMGVSSIGDVLAPARRRTSLPAVWTPAGENTKRSARRSARRWSASATRAKAPNPVARGMAWLEDLRPS